jgi:hypothetical protein
LKYGSEIWGYFPASKWEKQINIKYISKETDSLIIEKLHTKFCKYALGVRTKSSTFLTICIISLVEILVLFLYKFSNSKYLKINRIQLNHESSFFSSISEAKFRALISNLFDLFSFVIWETNLEHIENLKTYLNLKKIYNFILRQNNKHTKFGISAHDLRIERGRYEGLKVEDRICNTC